MYRSPGTLNFLSREMAYKASIRSGKCSQPLLRPNSRQNEPCTTMAWLGITSKKPDQGRATTRPRSLKAIASARHQPDSLQIICSLGSCCLRLPCLCCLVAAGKGSIQCITIRNPALNFLTM
jgi:hypothetical protein